MDQTRLQDFLSLELQYSLPPTLAVEDYKCEKTEVEVFKKSFVIRSFPSVPLCVKSERDAELAGH